MVLRLDWSKPRIRKSAARALEVHFAPRHTLEMYRLCLGLGQASGSKTLSFSPLKNGGYQGWQDRAWPDSTLHGSLGHQLGNARPSGCS